MTLRTILKSDVTKEGVKKILSNVDDLILKKKTLKNPSKLLQKKKEVIVDDKTIPVGPGGEKTTIKVKDFKAKVPEVSKETYAEFIASFQSDTIPKKILADLHIDKITKNEDIFQMINGIAKGLKPSEVVKQTRGVKTHGATKAAGTRLMKDDNFVADVLGTKPGTMYNAGQIYAIRQLLEAGATRLRYLSTRVANLDTRTQVDILKFRQHYALMSQIQKVLLGVKTETGRALNQFKIASDASKKVSFIGGSIDDINRKELIVELGGTDEITRVAELVLTTQKDDVLLKAVNETGLSNFAKKTSNAIAEVFINAILSNPLTHMRNGLGNWISQAIVQQERKYAAKFFGGKSEGGVAAYEDVAKAWGKHSAAKEIMAAMQNSFKLSGSKVETRLGQVTSQNFNIKNKTAAKYFDIFGKGITLGNYPTKFLKVADDYFKNREFRSEIYARSFAEGMEMFNKGLIKSTDDLELYIASRAANPTKEILDAAHAQARYVTFQTRLGERGDVFDIAKTAQTFKNYTANRTPMSWLSTYYLPFIRTPTNIAGFVSERTPVLAQVLTRYNSKIAAGGREAEIAKAQLHLGSMFYLATMPLGYFGVTRDKVEEFVGFEYPTVRGSDIRQEGKLTGGKSLLQKTTKKRPFQIELPIGDGKYQKIGFHSFDPVAQMFANSANFGQMISMMQGSIYNNVNSSDPFNIENNNYGQLGMDALAYSIAFTFSIGENLSNSTMLAGAGKMTDDINQIVRGTVAAGPTGAWKAVKEIGSEMASSYVPTIAKQTGKLFNDNNQKLVTEFNEYFKKNIAEGDLEYDYDMRGRRFDKYSYFSQFERDYIDEELDAVFPTVTPLKNYIPYNYSPKLGLSVSVPLKSIEKRFLRKNTGIIFDGYMKQLMEDPLYKNETRRNIKQGLIKANWKKAKTQAKTLFMMDKEYDDGSGGKINFFQNIKTRGEDLRDNEILNSQRGYINDNINNNN